MPPRTPPDSPSVAYTEWLTLLDRLATLAGRQVEAISEPGVAILGPILAEKASVYRASLDACQAAIALDAGEDGRVAELRAEAVRRLEEIDGLEARSRELLGARLEATRSELGAARHTRGLSGAYAAPAAGTARFMDQRR